MSTTDLTPTTELEAINVMLSSIGESPINTIDDLVVDASMAQTVLHETSREVQMHGWHCNTEEDYPLTPTNDGEILLPQNTLRVDTDNTDADIDVAWRGSRLYDRTNHTYIFTQSLKLELVVFLDFEELPEPMRYYITVKAARKLAERAVGAESLSKFTRSDETDAKAALLRFEGKTADRNVLTGNIATQRVLWRR